MTEQEQNLLNAAREILLDFDRYGEVLQTGDNGEYGTESSIGMLSAAIHQYKDSTPPDPQPSVLNKVKPLAQYLGEYIEYEMIDNADCDTWVALLEQALDAYQSTENVKIRIEPV